METIETPENNPQSNKRKEHIIIGVLAALLIGSLIFNFYQHQSNKAEKELLEVDLADTEQARIVLQNQLTSLTEEFEASRMDLEAKDSLLSQRDAEIFDKQKEIQNILNKSELSDSELRQAKRMINALNADITRFKQEIASLQKKNDSLLVVNDTLRYNQFKMSEKVVKEQAKSEATEQKMRSTFSVSNYQITGLRVRNSGKEVETDKAKRIDKMRVSFDLDPNEFAESGPKEIFIAIYKPDGTLGKFKDASPGELETWSLGKIEYSDKVTFDYTKGTRQNISFDWEEYDFPKGTYKIDLYQNGLKIGQKSLSLR
ncbi:MAG: hypothetical protein GX159_08305 [Flavobacteriaceae bacterium]|jgi:predicted  nucleic acid-binding Zn-ribbon protein|nr:hypothetical protein [Flavobacteriaceae bacterium]